MISVYVTCKCGEKVSALLERKYGTDQYHKQIATCGQCKRRMLVSAVCEICGKIDAYLEDEEEAK